MLAGAVNLPIEQLELQWSLRIRCVTKSEPKSGQTNRIQGTGYDDGPHAGRKVILFYFFYFHRSCSIATCPDARET